MLPWLALVLYAILSAAATGVGRLGFGVNQALSSRYTTFSTLFIISGLLIAIFWVKNHLRNSKQLPTKLIVLISSISTLFLVLVLFLNAYVSSVNARYRRDIFEAHFRECGTEGGCTPEGNTINEHLRYLSRTYGNAPW